MRAQSLGAPQTLPSHATIRENRSYLGRRLVGQPSGPRVWNGRSNSRSEFVYPEMIHPGARNFTLNDGFF